MIFTLFIENVILKTTTIASIITTTTILTTTTTPITFQDLEETNLQLKIENDRLREVSDVAKNQVELFEGRKQDQNLEMVISSGNFFSIIFCFT